MFLRFVLRLKADHLATFKERLSVTDQRCFDRLPNQVVSQLDVGPRLGVVEQVQIVFAVGRRDRALITHVAESVIESFELTGLQIVTAGKNQPLIARQHHTGVLDFVQSHRLLDLAVEDQVPRLRFLIRSYLQQHQIADDRIVNLGIVQRLIGVVDRFGIDAFAASRCCFRS